MEQAGCLAVAKFRGFDYGAIIYGGDDVASDEWNDRGWGKRFGIRYNLVMLCKELVKVIQKKEQDREDGKDKDNSTFPVYPSYPVSKLFR